MTVADNGRGFERERVMMAGDSHYGLQFMQERARLLGGRLQVQSAPGAGTRVVLEVPLVSSDERQAG
jgi:two-component system, NarL family, sensor histidine kinase DegS